MNSVTNKSQQESGNQSSSGMIMLNKSTSKLNFNNASQQSLKKGNALKQLKNNLMSLVEDLNLSDKLRDSQKNATNSTFQSTMNLSGGILGGPAPPHSWQIISDSNTRDDYRSPETPSFFGPAGDEAARGFNVPNMEGIKFHKAA